MHLIRIISSLTLIGTEKIIQPPSIWVIDLRTDKKLSRFQIPNSIKAKQTGFQSINVEIADRRRCDEAYAYLPNSQSNAIYVYR